jgi:hypothetical protein
MSQAAAYIEPALLNVKDLNYDSWQTIYFQRTTVIATELVLVYALHLYSTASGYNIAHADNRPAMSRRQSPKSPHTQPHCPSCSRLAF